MRGRAFWTLSLLFLLLFASFFACASNETNDSGLFTSTDDGSDDAAGYDGSVSVSSEVSGTLGNLSSGFNCLEKRAGSECEKASTVQELAFTILATPDNIMDNCIDKLKSKQNENNFGSIRDTALALLALDHVGEDTESIEKWLLEQSRSPTEIDWFLQIDGDGLLECTVDDGELRTEIEIDEQKKINSDAGECLSRAQSNFWYRVSPGCYSRLFTTSCNEDFITNFLYKHKMSSTIFVLEDTKESPAFGTTENRIDSKCLGLGSGCDYEGTAWGAFALQKTGNDIEMFVPYLISASDLEDSLLPNAFIYLVTGYSDYATELIQQQRFGSYWEAKSTRYNRYYDTALALLALGVGQEQTTVAKNWLLYEQGSNGCWANSIRETAFILWVLLQKDYDITTNTVYCEDAGFFCLPLADCSDENDVHETYYCSGATRGCCKEKELKSCLDMGGKICPEGEECTGYEEESLDTMSCCLDECVEKEESATECEEERYTCYDSCDEEAGYVEEDYDCGGGQVCCSYSSPPEDDGIPWWIWLLVVLIVVLFIAIILIYRKKKMAAASKKSDDSREPGQGSHRPGMPPRRPGMPPPRRRPGMPPPRRRPGMPPRRKPGMPPGRRPGAPPRRPPQSKDESGGS